MLKSITIKNFKSIADDTIELGRVNVFIGENGCGKSNILEAVGFASVAETYTTIDAEILYTKGIRVAKPSLMISSFAGTTKKPTIEINFKFDDNNTIDCSLHPNNPNDINSKWKKLKKNTSIDLFIKNFLAQNTDKTKSFDGQLNQKELRQIINSSEFKQLLEQEIIEEMKKRQDFSFTQEYNILNNYLIYLLNTQSLRGIPEFINSRNGIHGENLGSMIAELDTEEMKQLKSYTYFIGWLDDFFIDKNDELKYKGHKLSQSKSLLFFRDKLMLKKDNIFSSENVNEGVLHILFYLTLLISKKTPKFFAIDNIETALNPHLCRYLMTEICKLAKEHDKQLLITTHNPAILDGLNLFDDEIRLFAVYRNRKGYTTTERIKIKPEHELQEGRRLKLSELWTRGYLGAISDNY